MKSNIMETSNVALPYDPIAVEQAELADAAARSGTVKTTLDLSCFQVFDARSQRQGRRGAWFRVLSKNEICLSSEIGKTLSKDAQLELLLNRKGNIIVVRESPAGIRFRRSYRARTQQHKGDAGRVTCQALVMALKELGVELPAVYNAAWDDDLKVWVGRR